MSARKSFSLLACFVCLAIAATAWSAAAPSKLSYQAVLLNSGGQPVTTPVSVVFTIYDAASGGNVMWTETRNVTPDALGRVNVMLGDNTPVAEPVFSGPDRWLGIQVGVDPEMTPRTQFAASPYSRRVSTVDGSSGGTMEGNLTLRSTAAAEKDAGVAQPAQLTLISLNGDTIVVGPADQLVFRAVDASGANLMSATISGPNGPVLGIADPGGNIAEHSGTSSSYYGNSAKDGNALQKQLEVGADGVVVLGPGGDTLTNMDAQTGTLQTTGIHSRSAGSSTLKSSFAPCNTVTDNPNLLWGNNSIGSPNDLSGSYNSFAVGSCNILGNPDVIPPAGLENVIALGRENTVQSNQSFASGLNNFIDKGSSDMIVFGSSNTISTGGGVQSSVGSSILGGGANYVYGPRNTIVSGNGNQILRQIVGQDTIAGSNNTIAGGNLNMIRGSAFSFIAGGERNVIDIDSNNSAPFNVAFIGGGSDNVASSDWATVGGGLNNWARGGQSTVGGGSTNKATGSQTTVGGGISNTAGPQGGAVVAGGQQNTASGQWSTVGGGNNNTASGSRATVGGGSGNTVEADLSIVAGGRENSIIVNGDSSFIGGGYGNFIGGKLSVVTGGRSNTTAGSTFSFVGGGYQNAISFAGTGFGHWVSIVGGYGNNVSAGNAQNAGFAAIGGGYSNEIGGAYAATIPGGYNNTVSGNYSFAAGQRAHAQHDGSFVWADHTAADFASERADQFRVRADGGARFDDGAAYVDIRDDGINLISTSAGACLSLGGVWGSCSDINRKENIDCIDYDEILSKIAALDVTVWNYKSEGETIRHIGPMAQDFYSAFGLGSQDTHIGQIDADGVALAAIKALHKKTQQFESQKTEIDELREQIAELKQLVESMSHQR